MLLGSFRLALLCGVLPAWSMQAGAQAVKPRNATTVPEQATATPIDTAKVYARVEQMPQPAGGMSGLTEYLRKNLRYPTCLLVSSDVRVLVSFIVRADGHISNTQVVKSIDARLDEEAIRVISRMPPWTPGRQHGQAVKVSYTVPITFSSH